MICRSWAALAAPLAFAFAPAAHAADTAKTPLIERVRISPDGKSLVMVLADGDARSITVEDTRNHQTLHTIDPGAQHVHEVQWAGPRRLIITTGKTGYIIGVESERGEHLAAIDYDLDTRKSEQLLRYGTQRNHITLNTINRLPEVRAAGDRYVVYVEGVSFIDTPSSDGYYNNFSTQGTATLFKVELGQDNALTQTIGFAPTQSFAVDAHGATLAETEYDAPTKRWSLKVMNGRWREVAVKSAPGDEINLLGLGRDGATVLIGANEGGRYTVREVSTDGVVGEPLAADSVDDLVFDPATHRLIGLHAGVQADYLFFDPALQKTWRAIAAAYPGQRAAPVSLSEDLKKWVVRVDSPNDGPAYAVVDLSARTAEWLGPAVTGAAR